MSRINGQNETKDKNQFSKLLRSEIMTLSEFLQHFYQVLSSYLDSNEKTINNIFNLYVVKTGKNKSLADQFRMRYVSTFKKFSYSDNEVGYLYDFLLQNDREAIDFVIKTKKKILIFYQF